MTEATEIEFVRDYAVGIDRLWRALTNPDDIVQWFGPEGVDLAECKMNLGRPGPWLCVMVGRESGDVFKVSGTVTHTRPPDGAAEASVGFTFGWHDAETDARGPESHVIFELTARSNGARLRLIHRDLPDVTSAREHTKGWLSTLRKLDAFIPKGGV